MSEFSLQGKVIIVSGGARGLGLTQAEALLDAGAIGRLSYPEPPSLPPTSRPVNERSICSLVHALDVLSSPSDDFHRISSKATDIGTSITYHQVDVRQTERLNAIIESIADKAGGVHGLVAAAGIQQETPALEYTAADVQKMLDVNVTGVFMTAQAVAKMMIKYNPGKGGSICLIASMSATIANRVSNADAAAVRTPVLLFFIRTLIDTPLN